MNDWTAVLWTVTDSIGLGRLNPTNESFEAFQSAVFLAKRAGVDLGYNFRPVDGMPYSRVLARDFDSLFRRCPPASLRFDRETRAKLRRLADALAVPSTYGGTFESWIVAVASAELGQRSVSPDRESAPETARLVEAARARLGGAGIAA